MTAVGPNDPGGPAGLVDRDMLIRHVIGRATVPESLAVAAWLAADPASARELDLLRALWDTVGAPPTEPANDDTEWARLRTQLTAKPGAQSSIPRHPIRPQSVSRATRRRAGARPDSWPRGVGRSASHRHPWPRTAIAGAALAGGVGFVVAGVVLRSSVLGRRVSPDTVREYTTAPGKRAVVTLGDGTEVTLAPASQLRVPTAYGQRRRDVYLDGEAYFAVRHDSMHPFAVHAGGILAEDVGTRFGVRSYRGTRDVQVVVADGAVTIRRSIGRDRWTAGALLGGRTLAVADSSGAMHVRTGIDSEQYLGWVHGELTFVAAPLRDVVPQLNRWYDLDVQVADSALGDRLLTGTYGSEPASQVLAVIMTAVGAEAERRGNTILLHPAAREIRHAH